MKHSVIRWLALMLTVTMLLSMGGVAEDLSLNGVNPGDIDMTDLTLGGVDAGDGIELGLPDAGDDTNTPEDIDGIELGVEDGLNVDLDGTLDAALNDAALSVDFDLSQNDPALIDGSEGAGTGQGQFGIPGAKADNDALADAYLRSVLPGFGGLRGNLSPEAGRNGLVQKGLTGTVALYDALKPLIVEIAEGKRTSAEFSFDSVALGTEDHWWTPEELGASDFGDENLGILLLQKESIDDIQGLLGALLEDCPYHLYWFDKTQGYSYNFNSSYNSDYSRVRLETVNLSLPVAEEYAAGTFTVNALPNCINQAVTNINNIISGNSNKGDLDKLTAYADVICKYVEYNHPAADDDNTPYGNPWQLVWIFDGDQDTKVVCEGYAKGFKYLCDLSTFQGDVACVLVSGIMSYAGGSGGHMWNSLKMPDGKCYLVDLTSCDAGEKCDYSLFLKGVAGETGGPYMCKGLRYEFDNNIKVQFGENSVWLAYSNTAYKDESATGVRSISCENMVIYGSSGYEDMVLSPTTGGLVQSDYDYPVDIRLTVNENGGECDSVVWSSNNESIVSIDQEGVVQEKGFGKAIITGTLDGVEYQCKVDVREIKLYNEWVYTGEGFNPQWIRDLTFCMSVGQTVRYRLEEWEYDEKGQVVNKQDVTEKYPLTAENPEYLDVKRGAITALKTGSCQENRTSGVYCDLANDTIIQHQRIRFHIFTSTVEACMPYLIVESGYKNSSTGLPVACCWLTTNYYTGYFPLDDSMFITDTDWCLTRCLPEEFEWRSSDVSILKFTGKQEGSDPDRRYNLAYYDVVGSGTVTVSVSYHGTVLASLTFDVTVPENPEQPTATPKLTPTATPVPRISMTACKLTVKNQTYTGRALEPAVTVKYGNVTLTKGTDYTVGYKNNVKPGKGTVTVTGKGQYTGSAKVTFKILVPMSRCKLTVKNQTYTGKALKPTVTVKYGSRKLTKGADYTVSCKNNKAVGTATLTVKGKGGYTGTKKITFKILPRTVAISKLTAGKQSLTVKWTKRTEATGYELQYSLKRSFSGAKTVKIGKNATVGTTIRKLKSGKTYYVRIRSYKSVNKETFYSAWSKAKNLNVK